jgi:hypothetical protein
MPHPSKWRGSLDLKRKIKWKILLTLLLQKPPLIHGVKRELIPIIQLWMKQHNGGDWVGLIADYEHDVKLAHNTVWKNDRSPED